MIAVLAQLRHKSQKWEAWKTLSLMNIPFSPYPLNFGGAGIDLEGLSHLIAPNPRFR